MRRLLRPLWFVLALVFLFEGWLWRHLAAIVARVVHFLAIPALKVRLGRVIERLPPTATLLVFLIPVLLLLPIKLLGLWLLASGSWLGAVAVLGLAKVVSMGVTAFIFDVTKPKLLQLAWFRWFYAKVLLGLAWAHRQTDPIKERMRAWARHTVRPFVRRMRASLRALRPNRSGRFLRRLARLRRRVQRT
jgi:hypothetical protein